MPELPEVETILRGLEPVLAGQRLTKVTLHRPDLRFPFPPGFAETLSGQRIERLRRRGKYMLWQLEDSTTVLLHLGMSGRFTFAKGCLGKHDAVVFVTEDGTELRYNDPRRFGFMDLIAPGDRCKFLSHLGPEPLGNDFSQAYLFKQLQGRTTSIKARLLDQRVVVGVGNIYCCEALHKTGIHPARTAKDVSAAEAGALTAAIRDVLIRAIAAGGSSLRNYVQAGGELGYFQHVWTVYGREGDPCHTCAAPIQRIAQSNRSSFFCKRCQT